MVFSGCFYPVLFDDGLAAVRERVMAWVLGRAACSTLGRERTRQHCTARLCTLAGRWARAGVWLRGRVRTQRSRVPCPWFRRSARTARAMYRARHGRDTRARAWRPWPGQARVNAMSVFRPWRARLHVFRVRVSCLARLDARGRTGTGTRPRTGQKTRILNDSWKVSIGFELMNGGFADAP